VRSELLWPPFVLARATRDTATPRARADACAPGEDAAEAIALTPGRATVAGSIYTSHGVARYLTD
jgi:hypothetical protein